jgi:glycosyltransferase involved in cell wall biosynthesis
MPPDDRISIIVPCYNEGLRISKSAFTQFIKAHSNIDFLFVDDGSTDNTLEVLSDMCRNSPRISNIAIKHNRGKAFAVRHGVLHLLGLGYDFIGYWDADLSTPLEEIPRLHQEFSDSHLDIVMGSRVKILGHSIQRSLIRHLAGRIFATAASIILRIPVYDTQCGAKLFRNNHKLKLAFTENWLSSWVFDVELLRRYLIMNESRDANSSAYQIIEVPLKQWHDKAGSKVMALDFFKSLYELARIHFRYRDQRIIQHYRKSLADCS